jgi:hypothetical protein
MAHTCVRAAPLVWRGVLSVGGLHARLGATVPSRGFELAYSPGFRHAILSYLVLARGEVQGARRGVEHPGREAQLPEPGNGDRMTGSVTQLAVRLGGGAGGCPRRGKGQAPRQRP